MSSISSTDSNYQWYKNRIEDLEDENDKELKRRQKSYDEDINRLREAQREEIAYRAKQADQTVQDAKDRTNEALSEERLAHRNDLADLKKATYDRFGRYAADDKEDLRHQLDNLNQTYINEQKNNRLAADRAENHFQRQMEETGARHASELSEALAATEQKNADALARSEREQKNFLYDQKNGIQAKYDEMTRQLASDVALERSSIQSAVADRDRDHELRTREYQEAENRLGEKRVQAYAQKLEDQTRDMRDAHARYEADLRHQANDVGRARTEYHAGFAQGKADAVKQYENEWRTQSQAENQAYTANVDALHHQLKENESTLARINNENMKEKDRYFTGLISKQGLDNYQSQKELSDQFDRSKTQMDLRNRQDRARSEQASEQQAQSANDRLTEALSNQANNYRISIENQREANKAKLDELQHTVVAAGGRQVEGNYLPVAVEDRIRRDIQTEYEKTFKQERDREDGRADSTQREYAKRLSDVAIESQLRNTLVNQQATLQKHQSDQDLARAVEDGNFGKQEALRRQDAQNERGRSESERVFTNALEKQRQDSQESMAAIQLDAEAKILATRRDADFSYKMQQRAFSQRENELIRDYEKRLADQKDDYEGVLSETKGITETKLRDTERRSKLALEEQAKSYEQRIAQLQEQSKERERLMADNYQDDLEKIKRSNAQLLRKKS